MKRLIVIVILGLVLTGLGSCEKEETYCFTCIVTDDNSRQELAPRCGLTDEEGSAYEQSLEYTFTDPFSVTVHYKRANCVRS